MSAETCGGNVWHWTVEGDDYFLRDDRDAGVCEHERYSLFRGGIQYDRINILSMSREDAFKAVPEMIQQDQQSLNGSKQ
jgi:hypothetical protein